MEINEYKITENFLIVLFSVRSNLGKPWTANGKSFSDIIKDGRKPPGQDVAENGGPASFIRVCLINQIFFTITNPTLMFY